MKPLFVAFVAACCCMFAGPSSAQSFYSAKDAEAGKKLNDTYWRVRGQIKNPRDAAEPFQMIGNLYFVGIGNGEGYLLTSSEGHILFGAGLPESGEVIERNIAKLGFRLSDVKVILVNHAHADQAGGSRYLKEKSGAQLMAGFAEVPYIEHGGRLPQPPPPNPAAAAGPAPGAPTGAPAQAVPAAPPYPPVHVDRALYEGEVIKVGSSTVTTYLMPGHSAASTSFVFNVRDGSRRYKAIQYCCWEYPEELSRNVYINEASVRRALETIRGIGPIDIYFELGRYGWGGVLNQPDELDFEQRIENVRKNPQLLVNRDIFRQLSAAREIEFEQKLVKLKQTSPAYAP